MNRLTDMSSYFFNKMLGTQIQPSEVDEPQPKLYPTIVSLSGSQSHSLVVASGKDEVFPFDGTESHYDQPASNPSPGINIVSPSRQVQNLYSDCYHANYHQYGAEALGNQDMSYSYIENELHQFSLPENSLGESYGSYSEASFSFSPPPADSDIDFGSTHNTLPTHTFQELINQADPTNLIGTPSDFVLDDVFHMEEVSSHNGHLFAPGSYGLPQLIKGFYSSVPARPVETLVTSQGNMANDDAVHDHSCLSPMSTDMGESVTSSCNCDMGIQSNMLSPSSSKSPEMSGYPLSRTGSNKIRKAPSDLLVTSGPSGERLYHCKYCPHSSKRPNNLREHQMKHNPNRPKPFLCIICPKCFARKSDLKRHLRLHLREDLSTATIVRAYISTLSSHPQPHSSFG